MSGRKRRDFSIDQRLPSQARIYYDDAHTLFIGGGWGSAKSTAAAMRFLRTVQATPWRPAIHGRRRPRSVILGPSESTLEEAMIPTLEALVPPHAIRVDRKSRPRQWTFRTGHNVSFRSWLSEFEGANMAAVLIEEGHKIQDPVLLDNLLDRARDDKALERVAIVVGLPLDGPIRTKFDKDPLDPGHSVHLLNSVDNRFLAPEKLEQYRQSAPFGEESIFIRGRWMSNTASLFSTWSSSVGTGNLVALEGDRSKPVDISIDFGDAAFVLFTQRIKVRCVDSKGNAFLDDGMLVVDQMPVDLIGTTEDLCRAAAQRGWKIERIFTDPTARPDEIAAVTRVFPGIPQIRAVGDVDLRYSVEYGLDLLKSKFCDSLGNRRILVCARLAKPVRETEHWNIRRAIVQSITSSKKHPVTGRALKQNRPEEHGRDTLRYAAVHTFPLDLNLTARVIDRYARGAA